jgi:hypothetical protein
MHKKFDKMIHISTLHIQKQIVWIKKKLIWIATGVCGRLILIVIGLLVFF